MFNKKLCVNQGSGWILLKDTELTANVRSARKDRINIICKFDGIKNNFCSV
jgi:hypothetical protein